ncbi:MAG: septum formation protein Maf [Duodenibacillus sp.]|nr:septum formation protein Maf [Duodenibacillus sp.]
MPRLYLASKSPRRLAILQGMGVTDIAVLVAGAATPGAYAGDEVQLPGEPARAYVERTARAKFEQIAARVLAEGLPVAPVLAADTAVVLDEAVLGKPADYDEAVRFLRRLSGREHCVYTAVCAGLPGGAPAARLSASRVRFAALSEERIAAYARTAEPYDKAGGYGIQGLAGLFIDRIEGSYSGIMGLPVYETGELLAGLGLAPL